MPVRPRSPFAEWLEGRYQAWVKAQDGQGTVTQFAQTLGLLKAVVTNWLNGQRKPSPANVRLP